MSALLFVATCWAVSIASALLGWAWARDGYRALMPMQSADGRSVFTALVKPVDDGKLRLFVLAREPAGRDDPCWCVETLDGPDVHALAAEIQVASASRRSS